MPQPVLSAAERAALTDYRAQLAAIPTWQLLEVLPVLEAAAGGSVDIRCLFAVTAAHLADRLHLDRGLVLAHPSGPSAGVLAGHHAAQQRIARTN